MPGQRGPRGQPPSLDGALVRLPIDSDRWAESLPPVPRGHDVTVALSCADDADLHGEALALLGYRVVGVRHDAGEDGPCAEVLVPEALLEARPRWWRALNAKADRSFGLAFGPVIALLDEALRLHASKPAGW